MRRMTWAVLGSLLVNLMLGMLVAAVFSVTPTARAAEVNGCASTHHAAPVRQSPAPAAPGTPSRHSYLVEARMGWAIS
jgi:hypothetical protein